MDKEDFNKRLSKRVAYFLQGINRKNKCDSLSIYHYKNKHESKCYPIWYSSYRVNKIIDFILLYKFQTNDCSKGDMNRLIIDITGKAVATCKNKQINVIKNKIVEQINGLKSTKYYCAVPISNDLLLCDKYKFNNIMLIPYKLRNNEIRKHISSKIFCDYLRYTKTDLNWCSICVRAIDYNNAKIKAMNIIKSFLNAIVFLKDSFNTKYCIKIGPSLYSDFGYECLAYSREGKINQLSQNPYFVKCPLYFNKYRLTLDERSYLNNVSYVLSKLAYNKPTNKLERKIILTNDLIADGLMHRNRMTKIIKYMSAIESLLEYSHSNVKKQIRTKVPFLLSNNKKQRKIDWKNMQFLYSLRSEISHGEDPMILEDDVDKLFSTAKAVLIMIYHKYLINDKLLIDVHTFFKNNKQERMIFDKKMHNLRY